MTESLIAIAAQAHAKASGLNYESHKPMLLECMRQAIEAYEISKHPVCEKLWHKGKWWILADDDCRCDIRVDAPKRVVRKDGEIVGIEPNPNHQPDDCCEVFEQWAVRSYLDRDTMIWTWCLDAWKACWNFRVPERELGKQDE